MTSSTIIAAVADNRVIGNGPDIPWTLPGEQARFKAATMGHTLIMGRATFDSIGRPLPGRRTIVISRNPHWHHPGVETATSLEAALALAGPADEVFVAGGAQIYALALPFAQRMILTEVPLSPDGDAIFPEFDAADWAESHRETHPAYEIVTYVRR